MRIRNTIYTIIIYALFTHIGYSCCVLYGQVRFREFSRDRDIFERYADQADRSTTAEEWQRIVDSGRGEMTAAWERSALLESERFIKEGYDPVLVRHGMEEAGAEWEREFDDAVFFEKGGWRARQRTVSYSDGTMSGLKERVNAADSADLADAAAWESYVAGEIQDTESSWESVYAPEIERLYAQGDALSGREKEGFLAEVERIEQGVRQSFDAERDTILYLGKTGFIEKITSGSMTLREVSESKSAEVITDNIITDTEAQVRAEEEKILRKSYTAESGSRIDFTGLGGNWQEDLKKLIEYGMGKWESARGKMYNELISWKKTADEAYETAEAKWREGLRRIEAARLEWETKFTQEIYAGLEEWESGNRELQDNISQAREDFTGYMESMGARWSDSNHDLVDMAVNGSAVYADAVDNIKWLTEMKNSTAEQYAFSSYDDGFRNAIGPDIAGEVDAAITMARTRFVNRYRFDPDFSQSVEVVVTRAGKPGYNDSAGTFTETYKIAVVEHVFEKVTRRDDSVFGFNTNHTYTRETCNTAWAVNWNNVVTLESDSTRRTANCYYAFELARWERIRRSFSTMAADAEFYMHNMNMAGEENGAGYLTNVSGNYTTNPDGSADPYLMTGAEYSLELAVRDRDFWNQRLEIARSVLDYAEGRTNETAARTEQNMAAAKQNMEDSKAAYDNSLAAVNNILAELRNIQGLKPLTGDADAWQRYNDSYSSSMENLAKVYSDAETSFKTAEENYSKAKAAFITYKNMTGEDGTAKPVEYLENEIMEAERNIVYAEQSINRQREKLFIMQNGSDFTARTAGFAGIYSETVKNYEKAKERLELFRNIITGTESEADVPSLVAAIYENRAALRGDAADEYFTVLDAAVNAYNSAAEADRASMRDNVLLEIRQIYSSLDAEADIYRKSIEMLRDEDFDPEMFADTEYTVDHDVYADYARYSAAATGIIGQYFDDAEAGRCEKSYNGAWVFLKSELDKRRYVYGENNSDYIIHYTALKYFEERYKGLTAETWGQYRERLSAESDYAENAVEIHEDMAGGEGAGALAEMEMRASEGDIEAVQYLREYYAAGSGIPGLAYIKEYDVRADLAEYINESLKNFAIENSSFFIHKERLQRDHNYVNDLYGFITSSVNLGPSGSDNLFSINAFADIEPEEISRAAWMLQEYVASLEKSGIPVPESIRSAASAIDTIRISLDTELFIMSYMNNTLSGSSGEILAAAEAAVSAAENAYGFLQSCGDSIEKGTSYNDIAARIISAYENLSGLQKQEIDGRETSDRNKISTFITSLYSRIYAVDLAEHESRYIMNIGQTAPPDYAVMLPENMREQFISDMTPAYERKRYDLAVESGRAASIDEYVRIRIDEAGLDDETAGALRSYALIKDYLGGRDERPFSEQPFEVRVYIAEKFYYDMVFTGNAGARDIESLLEDKFGSENIDGDILNVVREYAGRLNAVLFYSGDTGRYIETLSPGAAAYFRMYIYGEGNAILPCYEYGIYGRESVANGKMVIANGMLESEIDSFSENYGSRLIAVEEYLVTAQRELGKARALDEFVRTGVHGKNWRDNAISVTDAEKASGADGSTADNAAALIEAVPVSGSGYMDGYDETGAGNVIVFSQNPAVKGTLTCSRNRIIDDVNRIAAVFSTLGKAYETETPAVNTISAFLEKADRAYSYLKDYTAAAGKYGFEAELDSYVSGTDSANLAARAGMDDLYSGLMSMETAILSDKKSVVSNNEIIEQLGDRDEAALFAEIEAARRVHETREREYQSARVNLDRAQENFTQMNSRYSSAMEDISEAYTMYKAAEVEYEKAYSIYEYANTSYLKESSTLDSGLDSAATADGASNTDYSAIPVPDARENYERVLARYNEAEAACRAGQRAVDNQESVAGLNINTDLAGEYADYKADFVRKSESYIRICQTDAVLNETIQAYRVDYEQKGLEYIKAKESMQFFAELSQEVKDDEEKMAELSGLRDRILSHIKGAEDAAVYCDAISWYSCWIDLQGDSFRDEDHEYMAAIKSCADRFGALAGYIQDDIKDLYNSFGEGSTLQGIRNNYRRYVYARYMKDFYGHRKDHTSKWKHPKRWYNSWKEEKNWKEKRDDAWADYSPHSKKLEDTFADFVKAKTEYIAAYTRYTNAVSVKTLDDVKRYLGTANGYNLTDEDLKYLYDTTTGRVDYEGINAGTIRNDIQRKDMDGASVQVKYSEVEEEVDGQKVTRGRVAVLNRDGTGSGESYYVTDAWIKVKLNGVEQTSFTDGAVYDLYDNNYDITEVTGLLRTATSGYRSGYMAGLMDYVQDSARAGTHDYTVMLRDLEETYNSLRNTAINFNSSSEFRQRRFEGYDTIMDEFAWNKNGSAVQQMIINEYIRQNRLYQEQQWQHQQEKYDQRRNRWEEVTGYILNRGMRDWGLKENEYLQKWRKWRIEAQKQIEAGKEWWTDRDIEMKQEMKSWGDDAGRAANKAAARKLYDDLQDTIDAYEKRIRESMPGVDGITIDTDSILNDTLKNIPAGIPGVLNYTMFSTDRVAGMAQIFCFGSSAALTARNREWQQQYEEAFGVMRNLQVLDVLNGIIGNFNKQLAEANKNVYRSVEYDLRYSDTFGEADFVRNERENLWTIRVCVESNLTGDKYKTRRFRDYVNMPGATVMLTPIKGIDGEIDFTKPETYAGIEASELDVYVGLESCRLNEEIENVFEEGGLFSGYVEGEFERLNKEFARYYSQWQAGEAMLDAGFYAKPMFPNGPDIMTAAAIAVSFTGNPWAMMAVSALSAGVSIADGTVSWQQAGLQTGIGFARSSTGMFSPLVDMAASGITYDEDGGVGWDRKQFRQGVKSAAVKAGVQFVTGSSVAAEVAMSAADVGGSWTDISFDNSHWGEHIIKGVASGISRGVAGATGNFIVGEMVQQGLLTAAYNMAGGRGFKTDYSRYNWNAMAPGAEMFGSQLGTAFGNYMTGRYGRKENGGAVPYGSGRSDPLGFIDDMLGAAYYGTQKVNEYANDIASGVRGFTGLDHVQGVGQGVDHVFSGMGASAANMAMDAGSAVWGGVKNFGEKSGNWLGGDGFVDDYQRMENLFVAYQDLMEHPVLYAENGNRGSVSDVSGADERQIEQLRNTKSWYEKKYELLEKMGLSIESGDEAQIYPTGGADNVDMVIEMLKNGELYQKESENGLSSKLHNAFMSVLVDDELVPLSDSEFKKSDKLIFKNSLFDVEVKFTKNSKEIICKMDQNDPDSVDKYAENLARVYCVYLTLYSQVVKCDSDMTDYSMGDFVKDLVSHGIIDAKLPARQEKGTQEILDRLYGEGKYIVYGAGPDTGDGPAFKDWEGNTTTGGAEIYRKLLEYGRILENQIVTLRFDTPSGGRHNMDVYNDGDDKWYKLDTSDYGIGVLMDDKKFIKSDTITSWYFIKKSTQQERLGYKSEKVRQELQKKYEAERKKSKKAKGK